MSAEAGDRVEGAPGILPGRWTAVRRANGCLALAHALAPPASWDEGLHDELASGLTGWHEAVDARAGDLLAALPGAQADVERTAGAHARLFLGPFEVLAPPWESLHLDPERRLMGPTSQAVAEAYVEAGLDPGPGPREVPDHVALELEFMYYLSFQEATTAEEHWAELRTRFWKDHLGRWLPQFAEQVTAAAVHPFYDALGEVLAAAARAEGAPG